MTSGSPVRLILRFALPILAGNLLQQLYNLVDSLIVGRLLGVTALAAVSASGWLDWAVLSIPMGLAQGFSIQAAQAFGAGDHTQLRRVTGQSLLLSLLATLLLEAASQTLLAPVLTWMNTPAETFRLTENYLRILYAGLPVVMAVNVLNGFLHALGNSRTPLVALACASCVNIGLDWVFVGPCGLGTNGGALATVTAQAVSAAVSFAAVCRLPLLHPGREDLRPDRTMSGKLLRLGLPIAFQNVIISVGGLILQSVVNGFGFIFMAGYNAASRLQGLVEIAGSSIGTGMGTFAAQNFGAGDLPRVRRGLRSCVAISTALAALVATLMLVFGRGFMGLFVRDDPVIVSQVLDIGYQFLTYMAAGLFMLYLLFDFRSTLQGLGDTRIPMLSGAMELVMRILCALLLSRAAGVHGLYFAEIGAWIGAAILLMFGYRYRMRRITQEQVLHSTN